MKKYKELTKNVFLFIISSFIPKTISFFLVPVYTKFLTTYEYGVSDLINTTVSLILPIISLNIKDAVLRFSINNDIDKKKVFSNFMLIQIISFIILFLVSIFQFYFNLVKIPFMYVIFFDILLLSNSLYDNFCAFAKGINKVNIIVEASVLNSLVAVVLNIILIVYLKMGLFGFLLANSVGIVFADILFFFRIKSWKYIDFNLDFKILKKMIKYSFPLIFSAIAWWVNNASDRYIVTLFCGVSISGIYAAASKIPSILTTLQNVFMQAWSISAIKDYDKKDSDGFIGNMYSIMTFLLFTACSILILFNIFVSRILFQNEFFNAWKYVPFLLISVAVDGLALFICNIFFAVNDTKSRAIVTIFSAVINTVLNFILILRFGAYGAAIATFIGYFVGFCVSRIMIKKYITLNANMKLNDLVIFLVFIQAILAFFGNKFVLLQLVILILILAFNIKKIKLIFNMFLNKVLKK